jgi:hypothetical protein
MTTVCPALRTQSTVVAWCALEEKGRASATDDDEEGWANALESARRAADDASRREVDDMTRGDV